MAGPAGGSRGRDAPASTVPYAELHCHSAFSFLDGASQPEDLVEEAVRLGLSALAFTDHDGLYGVVRFAEAAREVGLRTVFGAEISLGARAPRAGETDPGGDHLLVLARDPEGYRRLARLLSDAHLASGEKGRLVAEPEACARAAGGHWQVLTGCRKGTVPRALARSGPADAGAALAELAELFGRGNVAVELADHAHPLDSARNDALAELARAARLPLVATGNVHYAAPGAARLAAAMAASPATRGGKRASAFRRKMNRREFG
ncbi:PHP domain-containing protein [Frankia torreyi]|uniref:PHP domain-containing protein n=1 Tax=Frankia torreyi TaxID=1856 RepID=A0A0D8BL38_9ACTN|nr:MULTISPECIES: PHP domain-containing protein [Frankia]KJE24805.1 PHP domain-containing protein [Frankia torreyi]KQM07025.1 PHP domain-containing protein [Frankia sp. CpI1-P]